MWVPVGCDGWLTAHAGDDLVQQLPHGADPGPAGGWLGRAEKMVAGPVCYARVAQGDGRRHAGSPHEGLHASLLAGQGAFDEWGSGGSGGTEGGWKVALEVAAVMRRDGLVGR